MQSKTIHPAVFLKGNQRIVRAFENVERTYILDSIDKSGKTQESSRNGAV